MRLGKLGFPSSITPIYFPNNSRVLTLSLQSSEAESLNFDLNLSLRVQQTFDSFSVCSSKTRNSKAEQDCIQRLKGAKKLENFFFCSTDVNLKVDFSENDKKRHCSSSSGTKKEGGNEEKNASN